MFDSFAKMFANLHINGGYAHHTWDQGRHWRFTARVLLLMVLLRSGLPTVMPIFGHLGNTSALMHMSYFFQHDMKI